MLNRSELPSIYLKLASMITTQFLSKIKILCTDNAMEYKESSLTEFLSQNGTIVQKSCHGTSPQNGRVKRKYRHILDTVRAFLIFSSCPEIFWGEAALTAVYTINNFLSLVMFLHLNVYIIILQIIICLKSLVVPTLLLFNLMSSQN